MKKPRLFLVVFILITTTLAIFLFINKKTIKERDNEISDLEDKVTSLGKKVSELTDEKEILEKKLSDLTENQIQSFQHNTIIPNFQTNPPTTFNGDNGQISASNGIAIVVYRPSSCDYFILENASGYIVAEWMGSNDPDLGDKITGDFNSFGTRDFYNQTRDTDSRLWIDDYMLSKEEALDKIREQCK
jgi:hypothetical protein